MAVHPASLEVLEKAAVPMAEGRAELRTESAELRQELREKLGRSEFQAAMVSQVRHTYGAIMGAIMGQSALLLGAAYFFITHVQR